MTYRKIILLISTAVSIVAFQQVAKMRKRKSPNFCEQKVFNLIGQFASYDYVCSAFIKINYSKGYSNINMNSRKFILFFLFFTIIAICGSETSRDNGETALQPEQNQELQISVSMASSQLDLDQFQTRFFKINEIGRNKRKAYGNFIKKYEKFVGILAQNLFIPCKQAMIQSGIQMVYLGKKDQWEFSKQVALRVNLREVQKLQKTISSFKLVILKNQQAIQDITVKSKVIELFLSAKLKAQEISQLKYHGDMRVGKLKIFQIQGLKRYNQSCSEFQTNKLLLIAKYSSDINAQNAQCQGEALVKQLNITFQFELDKSTAYQFSSEYEQSEKDSGLSSHEVENDYVESN